jgi:hypothetical protein
VRRMVQVMKMVVRMVPKMRKAQVMKKTSHDGGASGQSTGFAEVKFCRLTLLVYQK